MRILYRDWKTFDGSGPALAREAWGETWLLITWKGNLRTISLGYLLHLEQLNVVRFCSSSVCLKFGYMRNQYHCPVFCLEIFFKRWNNPHGFAVTEVYLKKRKMALCIIKPSMSSCLVLGLFGFFNSDGRNTKFSIPVLELCHVRVF